MRCNGKTSTTNPHTDLSKCVCVEDGASGVNDDASCKLLISRVNDDASCSPPRVLPPTFLPQSLHLLSC